MAVKIGPEHAKNILGDVDSKSYFLVKDGRALKNLYELSNEVSKMDEATFRHHVTNDKNDFSNWVRNVHRDEELARKLLEASTQKDIQETVRMRIKQLESVVGTSKVSTVPLKIKTSVRSVKKAVEKSAKKPVINDVKKAKAIKIKKVARKPAVLRVVKKAEVKADAFAKNPAGAEKKPEAVETAVKEPVADTTKKTEAKISTASANERLASIANRIKGAIKFKKAAKKEEIKTVESVVEEPAKAGEEKVEEKPGPGQHLCPPTYFLKCSSIHFILGIVAGFLLGLVIASLI